MPHSTTATTACAISKRDALSNGTAHSKFPSDVMLLACYLHACPCVACRDQATVLQQLGVISPSLPCVTGSEQSSKAGCHEAIPSNGLIERCTALNGGASGAPGGG
jgi:hypothetical protein